MTADPTSSLPSPVGAADWYADRARAIPEPGTVTLTTATGESVTYYRRDRAQRTERAMAWPGVARTRESPPQHV
jgi:hypothetical protein